MTRIEQIEKLLEGWKAAGQEAKEKLMGTEQLFRRGGIDFGEAALRILKEPSNTQMQIDSATWQSAKYMCMRCGELLTEGSAGRCPRCD